MAQAKRHLTDTRVQGRPTLTLGELQRRLGCTAPEARRFLTENGVSYLAVAGEMAIDAAEFEAALASRSGARPAETDGYKEIGAELARRTRSAQGLPAKVSDPSVIAKVVALVRARDED